MKKNQSFSKEAAGLNKSFNKSITLNRFTTSKVNLNMSYIDPKQMMKMKRILKKGSHGINASFSMIRTMTLSPKGKRKTMQEKMKESNLLDDEVMGNILGKIGEEDSSSKSIKDSLPDQKVIKVVKIMSGASESSSSNLKKKPDDKNGLVGKK